MTVANLLKKYKNTDTFIDIDAYKGDELEAALDAGFKKIITLNLTSPYDHKLQKKFKKDLETNKVKFCSGSIIGNDFNSVLSNLTKPVLFYIDLHKRNKLDPKKPKYVLSTLLGIIKRRACLNHTFIINNFHMVDNKDILLKFDKIYSEPYYQTFETLSNKFPEDVLCASISG